VKRGDIVTIAGGIAIVIAFALAVQYTGFLRDGQEGSPAAPPVTVTELQVTPIQVPVTETPMEITPSPSPSPTPANPELYRIFYTSTPLDYPVFRLPEHMETFGASETPWKDPDIVPFAFIEEPRGGLTQTFRIPYGLWRMNISVDAWTKPQYARFDMVVCYASDGRVIDGVEILNPGSAYRNVQVSDTDLYIIIYMQNVDRFRVTFETPRSYYNRVAGT